MWTNGLDPDSLYSTIPVAESSPKSFWAKPRYPIALYFLFFGSHFGFLNLESTGSRFRNTTSVPIILIKSKNPTFSSRAKGTRKDKIPTYEKKKAANMAIMAQITVTKGKKQGRTVRLCAIILGFFFLRAIIIKKNRLRTIIIEKNRLCAIIIK